MQLPNQGRISGGIELVRALIVITAICLIPVWGFILQDVDGMESYLVGVSPHDIDTWYGVFLFPALHADLIHLSGNLSAMFVLMFMLYNGFGKMFYEVIILGWIVPGIFIWFYGRSGMHIGASGLVYTLASFIFFSGIVVRHYTLIAQSLIVVFLYGGIFWGIFPVRYDISWEGHLSGFVLGMLLAVFHRRYIISLYPAVKDENDEDDDDSADDENAYWKSESGLVDQK